jgi:hypothetical protein
MSLPQLCYGHDNTLVIFPLKAAPYSWFSSATYTKHIRTQIEEKPIPQLFFIILFRK